MFAPASCPGIEPKAPLGPSWNIAQPTSTWKLPILGPGQPLLLHPWQPITFPFSTMWKKNVCVLWPTDALGCVASDNSLHFTSLSLDFFSSKMGVMWGSKEIFIKNSVQAHINNSYSSVIWTQYDDT